MPPKKKLSKEQIEAMLGGDSDSDNDDLEEIFGPGVELEDDQDVSQSLPSTSGAGAQTGAGDSTNENAYDSENELESKYQFFANLSMYFCFCSKN